MCAYAYYLKFPAVREWVDAKLPVVKELNVKIVALWTRDNNPSQSPTPVPETAPQPVSAAVPAEVAAMPEATPQDAEKPAATPPPDTVDVTQLSQSRAEWPKVVSLKRAVGFPAVLNGKVVGSVKTPAGTQAHLIVIKDDKAGVEYQGGGAMVEISDIDLIERVRASRQANLK